MNQLLIFRQLFDPQTSTYTYLVVDSETMEAAIIDPVKEHVKRDLQIIQELGAKLKYVLETHVHADHITGAADIRQATGAKTVVGIATGVKSADITLNDGDELNLGSYKIKAIATPGHTSGCISYYINGMIFTGDSLMIRGTGRTDFQDGSAETLYQSITQKLFTLPDSTLVYPAHNYKGFTVSTIGEEKKFNPRLSQGKEEFVKIMKNLNLSYPKKIDVAVPANMNCGRN